MSRWFRASLLFLSLVQVLIAIACLLRLPIVDDLWPLNYTGEMSFVFLASISAAAAASTLWCVYADEPAALFGIGLDYVTIFTPVAITMFSIAARDRDVLGFAIFCAVASLFGVGLLLYSRKRPFVDQRPMPGLLRLAFVGFVLALIIGGSWVLFDPSVLPWSITREISALYGWFFIGAAAYFGYGMIRPRWANTAGQLAGFLAYDLILVVPFLNMLPTIPDHLRFNLLLYMSIVVISGILSAYYLFLAMSNPSRSAR
ncbi:MAG: hypothetical protein JNJ61_05675 [Anaerolineae bacterium]|nr:hypothetical protein [Anaerolineae bacterium]